MADDSDDKTEEPTQKRITDSRKEGQVGKSQDLSASLILLCGVIFLWYLGPWIEDTIGSAIVRIITEEIPNTLAPEAQDIDGILITALEFCAYAVAPFLSLIVMVAVIVNVYMVGLTISWETLEIKFDKLNPVNGIKQLFSAKKFVMLLMNMAKILVIMLVAYHFFAGIYGDSVVLSFLEHRSILKYVIENVWEIAFRMALVLFILGIVDFIYQKWKHNESLKMSKQEVKDEHKNAEGDPEVKGKRRQKMFELAQQRMMQEVPDAEVVVRNPTHYAVALRYKPDMQAPEVVAKGKNNIAMKIIEQAKDANVPVWQEPWLARQLYQLELGDTVPPELFQAVADILAHVLDESKRAAFKNKKPPAA